MRCSLQEAQSVIFSAGLYGWPTSLSDFILDPNCGEGFTSGMYDHSFLNFHDYLITDDDGHFHPWDNNPTTSVSEHIRFSGSDLRSILAFGERPLPVMLFISSPADVIPLKFTTHNAKGQVVSTGIITLQNVASSVKVNGGFEQLPLILNPNPAKDAGTTLNFNLVTNAQLVTITVADLQGNILKTLVKDMQLQAGSQAFFFETASLSNGTYIVVATIDGKASSAKLIVAK